MSDDLDEFIKRIYRRPSENVSAVKFKFIVPFLYAFLAFVSVVLGLATLYYIFLTILTIHGKKEEQNDTEENGIIRKCPTSKDVIKELQEKGINNVGYSPGNIITGS